MKRTAMAAAVLAIAALSAGGGWATEGPDHLAVGTARLPDGLSVSIQVDATAGTAWITRDVIWPMGLRVSITCVSYQWIMTPYPTYPYLPFHKMHASGTGIDGQRYYLSVFDTGPAGLGNRDTVAISTEPGSEACGGQPEGGPILDGDYTIAG